MQNKIYLFSLLLCLSWTATLGQSTQTEFGKNRVQFHNDFAEWSKYESRNFITYWYGEGRLIGQSVVQMAEYDFNEIQGVLEHRMNDKIEIIVYKDLTDLKQSNIGSEDAFENVGGQTKIVGNKMFVYFNGDHNDLRRQVREGIASVYLNAMLFGSNLQEIVQNAVMMNLPNWFKQGLIAFVGEPWSPALDNQLRDILLSEKYADFKEIADDHPALAGHSLWYFISQNFGNSTVSNLLYLTRINRSVDSGFLYVLGSTYGKTAKSWKEFYLARYQEESKLMEQPTGEIEIKNKHNVPITQVKISPDGQRIVYVQNEIGKAKVFLHDLQTGDRTMIFKNGFRNAIQRTDYNYPILAWTPNGQELAIIYEKRDVIQLMKYNVFTKDKITEEIPNQFNRIFSAEFINITDLIVSGAVRGQTELFIYYTMTRQTKRLTFDFWDDLDPVFTKAHGQRGILFASNRIDSTNTQMRLDTVLPITNYDIFYLNLDEKDNSELVRVTNTPYINERYPSPFNETWFSFLTDESGLQNRRVGYLEDYLHHIDNVITFDDGVEMRLHADTVLSSKLDSAAMASIDTIIVDTIIKQRAITHLQSNYDRSILNQSAGRHTEKMAQLIFKDDVYRVFVEKLDTAKMVNPTFTQFQKQRLQLVESISNPEEESINTNVLQPKEEVEEVVETPIEPEEVPEVKKDTGKIDIDNYLFQSEFDDEEVPSPTQQDEPVVETEKKESTTRFFRQLNYRSSTEVATAEKKVHRFRPGRITPYRLKFRTDYVTTQLDNTILFEGLNSFAGVPQDFGYPAPGILLKANFKDLLEDYQFEGGIRVPTTFNGAEYFLIFDDNKKRFDKRYALYRRKLRFNLPENNNIVNTVGPTNPKFENEIILGQYRVKYPLDVFTSIRATGSLRFDNTRFLATELATLEPPIIREQRLGLKLEYVFDNTLDVSLNIKNGTRYKFYVETSKGFNLSFQDGANLDLNQGFLSVIGADVRHYQRFLKHSVLAGRFAFASSFGSEKILYQLGGTDGWLLPKYNTDIPFPQSNEFAFQTVATNMRGFRLNIRNGNSFALINTELRMPVFRYIFPHTQSNFFRNFQLVGFFDAGTAWQGTDPFDEDSPINTEIISDIPQVEVKVTYFRDPIVFGYGAGLRTVLFGYFVRLDYAWGLETRQVQDPRLYLSIGMDF
jgi:hypothetical protein